MKFKKKQKQSSLSKQNIRKNVQSFSASTGKFVRGTQTERSRCGNYVGNVLLKRTVCGGQPKSHSAVYQYRIQPSWKKESCSCLMTVTSDCNCLPPHKPSRCSFINADVKPEYWKQSFNQVVGLIFLQLLRPHQRESAALPRKKRPN